MSSHQRRILKRATQRYSWIAVLGWIRKQALRILARRLRQVATELVRQMNTLRLPAPKSTADMLKAGVNARLGQTLHPRQHVSFAGV